VWVAVLGIALSSTTAARADQAPPPDPASPEGAAPETAPPEEPEERGVDLVLPVFRLTFGTSRSVDPGDLRGFAFDLVLGSRLAFQPLGEVEPHTDDNARWRVGLTAEAGYSRRAGDFGTHDLTLGLGAGVYKLAIGVHLFETIAFAVDGSGRIGARTTLRLETLWGLLHLDIGHEAGFVDGTTTHEIRAVIGVDVGFLISLVVFSGKLYGAAH